MANISSNAVPNRKQPSVSATSSEGNHRIASQEATQQVANKILAAPLDIAILKGALDRLLRYDTDNQFNFDSRRRGVPLRAAATASVLGLGAGHQVLCNTKSVFGYAIRGLVKQRKPATGYTTYEPTVNQYSTTFDKNQ